MNQTKNQSQKVPKKNNLIKRLRKLIEPGIAFGTIVTLCLFTFITDLVEALIATLVALRQYLRLFQRKI
jgi:hypothetical protein